MAENPLKSMLKLGCLDFVDFWSIFKVVAERVY